MSPLLEKNCHNRTPLSPKQRLLTTLRYLATGDSQRSIAYNFVVGRASVCEIVREVCQALWATLAHEYVCMPESVEQWLALAQEFEEKWDLPNVCALDGKHIACC